MENQETVFMTSEEVRRLIREEMKIILTEFFKKANAEKVYNIAETAKLLGKAYNTIVRMMRDGRIETTADGRYISQKAIDHYLIEL